MNTIVMIYSIGGEFTYYSEVTLPIIHESPESAYCEFIDLLNAARHRVNEEMEVRRGYWEQYDTLRPNYSDTPSKELLAYIKSPPNFMLDLDQFIFNGMSFHCDDFTDNKEPLFYTIDEWVKINHPNL